MSTPPRPLLMITQDSLLNGASITNGYHGRRARGIRTTGGGGSVVQTGQLNSYVQFHMPRVACNYNIIIIE